MVVEVRMVRRAVAVSRFLFIDVALQMSSSGGGGVGDLGDDMSL